MQLNLTFGRPCIVIYSYKKPTRCTNFSNLFLKQNSTCFGQVLCPSSGVQPCTHSNRYMSYRFCLLLASGIILIPLASRQHNLYDIYVLLCVQCQTPDDGQRNSPEHLQFCSKNKIEKLVHLFGFIIRMLYSCSAYLTFRK